MSNRVIGYGYVISGSFIVVIGAIQIFRGHFVVQNLVLALGGIITIGLGVVRFRLARKLESDSESGPGGSGRGQ